MGLTWMAWTWPTAAFFGFIALCLIGMTSGSSPRPAAIRGAASWGSTRRAATGCSSRCSGRGSIFLLWLAIVGTPLWGALAIALVFAACVFRWV